MLATIERSFFDRSGDHFIWFDNYHALFTTPSIRKAIENNAIWVAVVPAHRDRDRTRVRGAHRAHRVVRRVQDGRVHADGRVAVRGRRDLARDVPAGSVAGRRQRGDRRRARRDLAAGGTVGRAPLGPQRHGHVVDRHRPQVAPSTGPDSVARADGHPADADPEGLQAGHRAGEEAGRDHRHGLARLQARRRRAGQGRAGRARASGRDRRAEVDIRLHASGRRRRPRTARSRSRDSPPEPTRRRSARTPSASRSRASAGSGKTSSRLRS